jgi:hypothetical protein
MDVHDHIRDITDEECETIVRQGWVKLPGLISPELAGLLRQRAERWMGADGKGHTPRPGVDDEYKMGPVENFHYPWQQDDLFGSLATSPRLARNAAWLLHRVIPMRLLIDAVGVNIPVRQTGRNPVTTFHQPGAGASYDRDVMGFSIALDEARPEQGSLQFFSGSHAIGMMGSDIMTEDEVRTRFTRIAGCELVRPQHLQPGDATAHMSTIMLGVPANQTERSRWSYVLGYMPADTRYTGVPSRRTDGRGLAASDLIAHADFPIVYEPTSEAV